MQLRNRKLDMRRKVVITPDRASFYHLKDSKVLPLDDGKSLLMVTDGHGNLFALHTDAAGEPIDTRHIIDYADASVLSLIHPELTDTIVVDQLTRPDKKGVFLEMRDSSYDDAVWSKMDNNGTIIRAIRTPRQIDYMVNKFYPSFHGAFDKEYDDHGRLKRISIDEPGCRITEEYCYDPRKAKNLNRRSRR